MSDRDLFAEACKDRDAFVFARNHIVNYSMHGKTARDGVLVWFYSGEPCGTEEGDKAHFDKVAERVGKLNREIERLSAVIGALEDRRAETRKSCAP